MPAAPRPSAPDSVVALADQCVQCGLCLPACPTYRHDRLEAESPRGRIAVARAWALDALEPTPTGDVHLDNCLACRSCEAVCPAGVQFGPLLFATRESQRRRRGAGWRQRAIESLAARPWLMSALLATYRRLYPALPARLRPLPRPPRRGAATVATEGTSEVADLFVGCAAAAFEPPVRRALATLAAAVGVQLNVPDRQTCCGSLHAHAGNADGATTLAARNAAAFRGTRPVLTLASGCHEAVASAIGGSADVTDALDFLAARLDRLAFRRSDATVALHLPCTQRNLVRSVPALRRLLAAVPGLKIIELDAGFGCCGAAGTQMLTDPARAASFRVPLDAQVAAARPDIVLSANIGCRLHLANGCNVPVQHPVEFLAAQLDTRPSVSHR